MANTVFVLGGGRTGSIAVRDLTESNVVDSVIVGDIETSRAEKLVKELGSHKVSTTKVDASDLDNLVNAIRHSQVLINATWYEHNIDVMKAAIEAKVHYTDLGGLFHVTRKQMEFDQAAQRAGVTAVIGGGESPGITNIMCRCSAEEMDSVEEIRIRVGAREMWHSKSDKLLFPFAISTIFDEYSKPPLMFLNGKFEQVEPLSGEEKVEFPQPVGRNVCHYSIHSEIATLPINFEGVRHVDFKLGLSKKIYDAIKPLIDAGMPRDSAIAHLAARGSDEEPSRYVALRTEVTGLRSGRKMRQIRDIIGQPSERIGGTNATTRLTGIAASIIAQLILRGQIRKKGVVAPETSEHALLFMKELEERKIIMTRSTALIRMALINSLPGEGL
jgi:saccharopine dehydrogenase-like NADP-dependent oxidoreductase